MNKKLLIGIVVLVAILAVAGFSMTGNRNDGSQLAGENQGRVYCGSDGELTNTQPIQSHRSYCIKSNASGVNFAANTPASFAYSIIDDQGNILKELDTVHEKQMHFIVVRKDLANFQHVHPEFNSTTGEFTLSNLTLPTDGEYRLFADFTPTAGVMGPEGEKLPVTISEDIRVGNISNYNSQPIGELTTSKAFDGYQVTLATNPPKLTTGGEGMLTFDIKQNGKPVTDLEKYLGALGHSVILSEGDLQFIHAHPVEDPSKPQTGKINFMVFFPEAGKYKVFSQFQRNGKITTTDFVIDVAQGKSDSTGAKQEGAPMTH